MNAPAVAAPAWVVQVQRDAVSVAVYLHSDFRRAHAAALAWRAAEAHGVAAFDYAVALSSELATLGMPMTVPVLGEPPSGISDRYALAWRVSRMASGGSMIVHGLEIGKHREWERPFWVGHESSGRYASGLVLDDVERVACRMLREMRRLGTDSTDALRARAAELRAVVETAERG